MNTKKSYSRIWYLLLLVLTVALSFVVILMEPGILLRNVASVKEDCQSCDYAGMTLTCNDAKCMNSALGSHSVSLNYKCKDTCLLYEWEVTEFDHCGDSCELKP